MPRDEALDGSSKAMILAGLSEGQRIDGRGIFDLRPVHIAFGRDWGHAEAHFGSTKVMVRID